MPLLSALVQAASLIRQPLLACCLTSDQVQVKLREKQVQVLTHKHTTLSCAPVRPYPHAHIPLFSQVTGSSLATVFQGCSWAGTGSPWPCPLGASLPCHVCPMAAVCQGLLSPSGTLCPPQSAPSALAAGPLLKHSFAGSACVSPADSHGSGWAFFPVLLLSVSGEAPYACHGSPAFSHILHCCSPHHLNLVSPRSTSLEGAQSDPYQENCIPQQSLALYFPSISCFLGDLVTVAEGLPS